MSISKNKKSVLLVFSARKENWNDSTESIQRQKITKLTQSDTLMKINPSPFQPQVSRVLGERDDLIERKGNLQLKPIAAADTGTESEAIFWVTPKNSNSGELAILKVTLSRPESRIIMDDVRDSVQVMFKRETPSTLSIVEIVESSEQEPKDRVPWRYLRHKRVYKEPNKKTLTYWLKSIHFHYSRILGRGHMLLSCPNCTFPVKTKIRHVRTIRTKRFAYVLAFVGLCGFPYIIFLFKDVVHTCPLCNIFLGFCPAFQYRNTAHVVKDVITPVSMTNIRNMKRRMSYTLRNAFDSIRKWLEEDRI